MARTCRKLTTKQETFAQCVAIKGMSFADAYREAFNVGEKTKDSTVWHMAWETKNNPNVSKRIQELKKQKLDTVLLDSAQILAMYNAIAMANIEDAYDEKGKFHIENLPKGCVKKVKKNKRGQIIGAELYDKQKSLDKLADIYELSEKIHTSTDGIEVSFKDGLEEYSE